jgi:DNA-binding NtrC family response regulator
MRMRGMSGADLLRWVAVEHPDTLRIILSGQADEEGVLRSVGPAHQFLSKPCEPEMLIDTVRRASHLRDLLASPELLSVVMRLGTLPSTPALYAELVEELQAPEPSSHRIGVLISSDIAMSAKVLQLVNSAFFGMPVRSPLPSKLYGCWDSVP